MRLGQTHGGGQSRGDREGGHHEDRGRHAEAIGQDPGCQRADRIAEIPPEPVDAHRRPSPGRAPDVADHGKQCGIHHRRAQAEADRRCEPRAQAAGERDREQGRTLEEHPPHDQVTPAPAIAERSGDELGQTPGCRICEGEDRDLIKRQTARGEEEREEPPGEPVVQVVDQTDLARRCERRISPGTHRDQRAEGRRGCRRTGLLQGCVRRGVPHSEQ